MAHGSRGWMVYTSSSDAPFGSVDFSLKCDAQTALNNGSSMTKNFTRANFWPAHRGDLRSVSGVDSSGKKDTCIANSPTSPLYAIGATFQDALGNTYTVTSLHAERVRISHLK